MENMGSSTFFVGHWSVHPTMNRISDGDELIQLEPQAMLVLEYLSAHAGEVVSRKELEANIWHGRVVSYDAVTNNVVKIRKAFHDDPKAPKVIETLSKKGYRLVAPVSYAANPVQTELDSTADIPKKTDKLPDKLRDKQKLLALLFFLASMIAVIVVLNLENNTGGKPAISIPLSIVVLPFENRSASQEQDYFSDGITDDLIAGLAKNPELLVIARDSSFHYKREPLTIKQIAAKLNVNFVLHGSVMRDGEQVRVNAKLLDVRSQSYLWAETYNSDISHITSLQDGITNGITTTLLSNTAVEESSEREYPTTSNGKAYDSFLQGRQLFYLYANRAENQRARELFKRAIKFDQSFAMAYAMLAWTHAFDAMNGWSDDRQRSLREAIDIADKALSLQTNLPLANFVTGLAYRERGEYVKAMAEAEKAIQADPNYANAHVLSATLLYYAGMPIQGLERIQKAIKLNPHHPYNYSFHLGQAYYVLGRYSDAINAFINGINSNPSSERLHVWLAAAYAQIGALEDAEWEITQVLVINPSFSIARAREIFPFKDQADREHFIEGLSIAGLL